MTGADAPTVVVTYPAFDDKDPHTAGALRAAGLSIVHAPRLTERSPDDVVALMSDAVAGVVSSDPFDRDVFASCPRLRVLARVGVGVDSIDLDAATAAGICVTTTPGVNTSSVADHTLALMLACTRRVLENDLSVKAGEWDRGGRLIGTELSGSTVGIVGLGAIGSAVARRLAGFDVTLLGYDIRPCGPPEVRLVELDELLRESDVVTLHVPSDAGTRHLIGSRELALMRPGSVLVNVSRGGIIDEDALHSALAGGGLAGAALDVFAHEPPSGSPLLDLPQVVATPHIAGISVSAQQEALEGAVRSVLDVLGGRRPHGLVNPGALSDPPARTASAAPDPA
jgi:D-3-phosphoglycerate dehydrogenase / 2-oxoglutarate reductase